ncbi:MAG: amino acid transporter [Oleiphilus sp.]|nr:MAG: amino acid transporter [Oleiphilus sp.]
MPFFGESHHIHCQFAGDLVFNESQGKQISEGGAVEFTTWLIYVSVIGVLILSPGPSALLCLSDGLNYGRLHATPTVLGGATAALCLMLVSIVGLGAVLVASDQLFYGLKLAGAGYLCWLGSRALLVHKHTGVVDQMDSSPLEIQNQLEAPWFARFWKGFLVGISNPKDLLFFIALFPGFIEPMRPLGEQYIALALTWFLIDCGAMLMYAGLGANLAPWMSRASNMVKLQKGLGVAFIGLGVGLAITAEAGD